VSRIANLWWERRRLWLPAAIFVAVGLALLLGYQLVLADRLGLQSGALAARRAELDDLSRRRRAAEAMLEQATGTRAAVEHLYADRLGSEASRLTAVMLEVKHLARRAGLAGMEAISYGTDPVPGLPLVRKSITFSAEGTYAQLRSFVDLLEQTPSFLSLDEIRVEDEAQGGQLRLQVRLSTLFVNRDESGGQA
jgi:Tfp pilus assembly protein PilO